jgi:signal transduction histidine kinase/ligand-binding sensor domain-containing protein
MWFGTEGGLARFDGVRFTIFNTRNTPQLHSNDIRSLLVAGGSLWIATADGVAEFGTGPAMSFSTAEGLPSNNVIGLYLSPKNVPCAATTAGNACFERGRYTPSTSAMPPPAAVTAPVLSSMKDREGNLWVGTESSGVTIFRSLEFRTFAGSAENLDDVIRCVFADSHNAIWAGTNSRGLVRYQNGTFSHLTVSNGLSSDVIVSLGEDSAGDLYVGTPDGLNRIHNGAVSVITSADGLPDDFIRSIHGAKDGGIWIGTRRGVSLLRDGHFQNFTHADGLGSDLVGSVLSDAKGVWIATLQGLTRRSENRFTNFTVAQGLSSNVITALYEDTAGTLWIGTQGGGLNRLANSVFQHFPPALGLPDVIYGIAEDNQKNLWLASDAGIFRVSRSALDQYAPGSKAAVPEVISYGTSDGLRVSESSGGGHPGITKGADGSIWFATLKGVAVTRAQGRGNQSAPPVVIESVTIDDKTVTPAEAADVPPGHSRFAFKYTALSFTAPQKVTFRYKLEGFDKGWLSAGAARVSYYTNLGPGPYRFRVTARNEDGVWSEQPATLAFRLEPRFYQTWWFALLAVVAVLLAGYGAYRWRVAQVEAQFSAVLGERNRIAREIHDTLAQGFAGISVQLELVARKLSSSSEGAREHLDQARMLVRSSLAEARRSIWELRSQSAEMEDLAARLAKMANQMGAGAPGKIALEVRGTYRPVGARLEDELLRIAQEAVTNALRHAEASNINIQLAFDPKLLHMTVADNGRGFTPGAGTTGINGHFGLQGMRERAERIGARFAVETAPGQGTRISIEAPIV